MGRAEATRAMRAAMRAAVGAEAMGAEAVVGANKRSITANKE
ncbi:MAG: hypothetical protein ACLQED_11995 [Desulfobaccales bacterium]